MFKFNLQLFAGQAKGVYSTLKICPETTYGEDPAMVEAYNMPFNSNEVVSSQNLTPPATITGRRDPVAPILGNVDVSGSIVVPLDANNIGAWFRFAFGDPITTGSSAPYMHEFKPGEVQPSYVIERGFQDIGQYFKYNGCKVSRMSFVFGGDGELTVTIELLGGKETIKQVTMDASPTHYTFTRYNNFQAAIKEAGVKIGICTNITLDIDFGLDGDTYVIGGGGFRGQVNEGIINISGTLTAFFEDETFLNKAINATESSVEIMLASGSTTMSILLPELLFARNSPGVSGATGIKQELQYSAYYDDSIEDTSILVTLENDVADYTV